MSEPKLMEVANLLNRVGFDVSPTAILAREIPIYEIEFAELEFAEETKLPSSGWAVLALTRALGQISPNDVDAYLGLGETVSDDLVDRLRGGGLLPRPRSRKPPRATRRRRPPRRRLRRLRPSRSPSRATAGAADSASEMADDRMCAVRSILMGSWGAIRSQP